MMISGHFDSFEETLSFLNESEDDLWELECEYGSNEEEDETAYEAISGG